MMRRCVVKLILARQAAASRHAVASRAGWLAKAGARNRNHNRGSIVT